MSETASWVLQTVVLVVVFIVATVVIERVGRRRSWLDRVKGERVLVHTVHDQTVEGSLVSVQRDGLVLRAPRLIDDAPVSIAGEIFVPREKVALVQRAGGTGS